ncbi:glycosyltransferase family 2 protein [Anaerolineae bacterium CFX8]|nr:glycosyltransferase family 2 protein [Anaerolineae bacterium CFX8]
MLCLWAFQPTYTWTKIVPYQSSGGRRNNVQLGVGRSLWAGAPPPAISERALDGIPGCLAWVALLFSIAAAIAYPRALLLIAALLGFYTAVRFLFAGIANMRGLRLIAQWEHMDWRECYDHDASPDALAWDDVHHIVIIPNYKEPVEILSRTLDNLAAQYEAAKRLTVVLAMEAAEEGCVEKAESLVAAYRGCFANLFFTVHPRGLPGEMQCKSANQAWAARWVKRRLVDQEGYPLDHILVTTQDADTLWHKNHFYALTYLFATHQERHLRFWQGPIRYHTNIWEINPLLRIVNAYSGAFELAYLAAPWWIPMPMSSYALSLRLLDASGYWDPDVIADDWHMFIKAYFSREGRVKLERVFLPFMGTAVTGNTWWEAIKNRYLQSLRHAWGSKEVGYIVAKMLEYPEIEFKTSFQLLFRVAHDILLAGAGWVILTVGSQLPVLLNPQIAPPVADIIQNPALALEYPTFILLSIAGALVVILGIIFWYQDVIVRPPRTTPSSLKERLLTLLSFPLLPVLTLLVVALPTLQAQTRLLVGIPLRFRVSRKV